MLALGIAGALSLTACGGGSAPQVAPSPTLPSSSATSPTPGATPPVATPPPATPPAAPPAPPTLPVGSPGEPVVVAAGLATPWSVVPLADGGALVSERDTARVLRVSADGATTALTATGRDGAVEGVTPRGEGGLLGLALAPGADPLTGVVDLYAFTTTADDGRVVTMALDLAAGTLDAPVPILTGLPAREIHHGGRIEFGPDGMLYVGAGDSGDTALPQDGDALGGKVLRVAPTGAPAPGNPDPASPVWTSGHRNVQGFGWDAAGRMFASEFGQQAFDELNLIQGGANYGWPVVEGFGDSETGSGFADPLVTWPTAEASPSGVAVTGDAVYLAALRGQRLWRVPVGADGVVGEPQAFLEGQLGRIRDVTIAPQDPAGGGGGAAGGSLLVVTDDARDGQLVRVPLV